MTDGYPTRLAFRVALVSAVPIEGTDQMIVTVKTEIPTTLELKMTRIEAVDLVELISAERSRVICAQ